MSDSESDNEEVEPKFKYVRLSNDLKRKIFTPDAISTVKVHAKHLCIGTHLGHFYLFDHLGNIVEEKRLIFAKHMVSLNQISVDAKGEFVASCSDEGLVTVNGIFTTDNDHNFTLPHPVRCIQLDPQYAKSNSGRRFIVGDTKLTLYEKTFYKSLKATILCQSEGLVSALEWCDQYVAWASGLGVHVYNLVDKCSLGLIRWEEPVNGTSLSKYRCNLRWSNATTLLIGWVDTIRICVLRKSKDLAAVIVDPISTFRTDFYISGLAPLDKGELVVLGVPKQLDAETGKPLRPQLCVLQYKSNNYVEVCTDSLSMRGYQEYEINDYCLDLVPDEKQFFVVSPKDVVVASLLDKDELVAWLIEHRRFDRAMDTIAKHGGRYSSVSVARLYVDHLLAEHKYEEAAQLCSRTFGSDTVLWEEEVYKFVKIQQLRSICPYLPQTLDCRLNQHVYEIVLYEYMKTDPEGFLKLIRDWPPDLYSASAVRNAVKSHINEENQRVLLEAIAILYTHEGMYAEALAKYLKLQHADAFQLVRKHGLQEEMVEHFVVPLMQLDMSQTIDILLAQRDHVQSEVVVQQLRAHPEFLLMYLDQLVKVDPVESGKFHWQLLTLYIDRRPDKLLSFLKRSHNYPIRDAYELCERKRMHAEMVFLLDKMGNTNQALLVIVEQMRDIQKAIQYCKQINDADLWNDLVKLALKDSETITRLLDGIAGYIDPRILVTEIQLGQEVKGLKKSLTKMMKDYSLQVKIEEKCNEILAADYFNLHERIVTVQQRGVAINSAQRCGKCDEEMFAAKEAPKRGVVYFNCHHFFHDTCLPRTSATLSCIVCKPG